MPLDLTVFSSCSPSAPLALSLPRTRAITRSSGRYLSFVRPGIMARSRQEGDLVQVGQLLVQQDDDA